jgi:hypothetical protein
VLVEVRCLEIRQSCGIRFAAASNTANARTRRSSSSRGPLFREPKLASSKSNLLFHLCRCGVVDQERFAKC